MAKTKKPATTRKAKPSKKPSRSLKTAPVARRATPVVQVPTIETPVEAPVVTAAPEPTVTATAMPFRSPVFRARNRTEAQKRGAELVRFLRIHNKTPYGHRGQSAIYALACEVGHLGRVQLGEATAQ
jgi:hypothetical protein